MTFPHAPMTDVNYFVFLMGIIDHHQSMPLPRRLPYLDRIESGIQNSVGFSDEFKSSLRTHINEMRTHDKTLLARVRTRNTFASILHDFIYQSA